MDALIKPGKLRGVVAAVASKSVAHRVLILAALADGPTDVDCNTTSEDIEATVRCLEALGARIARTRLGFRVHPVARGTQAHGLAAEPVRELDCGESGSTLRFMLPVACALGRPARLSVRGRLSERPLTELSANLSSHGCSLSPAGLWPMEAMGPLVPGDFSLPGNVSSQYVTGLLLAASVLDGPSRIYVTEPVESAPYIAVTTSVLSRFGVEVGVSHEIHEGTACTCYAIDPASTPLGSPGAVTVEGDWSNAAFWLAVGAFGEEPITVTGLDPASAQGDRAMLAALALFGAQVRRGTGSATVNARRLRHIELDVSDIPDLVPPLAAVAARAEGTSRLYGASRLRLKESDRLQTVSEALRALGIEAWTEGDDLLVTGGTPIGGTVDAANDHRIAMMASVLASTSTGPATILGATCVNKSYPDFYDDYAALGGNAELA